MPPAPKAPAAPGALTDRDFKGTERFEIVSRLGAGGMGVVYESIDRSTGRRLALKTLQLKDANSIYRFKKEFRGLADISHPNLVTLHELIGAEKQWFFTMELVRGTHFLHFLRRNQSTVALQKTEALAEDEFGSASTLPGKEGRGSLATPPADVEQLRSSLRQLAEAVHALHFAGKLHRDIKPSNMIIDDQGRLVLLDFGLAMDLADEDGIAERVIMGTVAYMSPEQARQGQLGPASDWYSVGVVLYEALTGELPYTGKPQSVLMDKQRKDAVDPRQLVEGLPEDLAELAMELLNRDPNARPAGADILRRLGASGDSLHITSASMGSSQGDVFVGRAHHLARLDAALVRSRDESVPQCLLIHGAPGIGKSTLLAHFCEIAQRERGAVVLAGRCYERELVPFKALDTLVDALSRHLSGLPEDEVAAMLPEHTLALARLFPVMRTVPAIARQRQVKQPKDPQEARRRGLAALRELLAQLAAAAPLIIRVDDFQWGDTDSAVLLASLLGPPQPPNLLLCICYRRDDAATSEALLALRERLDTMAVGSLVSELPIDRLSEGEVEQLAQSHLGHDESPQVDKLLRRVASESQGNPFFVEEIVRYLQTQRAEDASSDSDFLKAITLRETMLGRFAHLSQEQRRLLDVVAVAGAPITEAVALTASGIEKEGATAVSVLRAGRLLRSNPEGLVARLESYHDRIREVIVEESSEARLKATYCDLGRAHELHHPSEHQTIANFYSRADEPELAASHAIKAADLAMETLAFERAAFFYRMALKASTMHEDQMQRLRALLAEALSNAGRGVEAAAAHLEAASQAARAASLDHRRQAAESLLRAGHVDQAVDIFRDVLESVGLRFSATSRLSLMRLLAGRLTLRVRGTGFKARDESQLSPETLLKIDVCGSCALGFGMNDSIRGAEFQTRHLLLALRAGETSRVGRALALEAIYRALEGRPSRKAAQELIDTARGLADEADNPLASAFVESAQALAHFQCGEWSPAREHFDEAAAIYLRKCRGHQAAACQAQRLAVDALYFSGEIAEFSARVPGILRAADDRGDLHGITDMQTGLPNASYLVRGQAAQARFECERGQKQWSDRTFFLQHYYAALAQVHIDLYEGSGIRALERCDAMWPALRRSFLLRVSVVGAQANFLLGRALVLAAHESHAGERGPLLARATLVAKGLGKRPLLGAAPWSHSLLGQIAMLRGDQDGAVRELRRARGGFQGAGMQLHEQGCAGLLGQWIGGDEGSALLGDMDSWMQAQGVIDARAFARLATPLVE